MEIEDRGDQRSRTESRGGGKEGKARDEREGESREEVKKM